MKNIAGLLQELKYTVIDGKPEGEISELVYDILVALKLVVA